MRNIKINEYEVIEDIQNGVFKALRHGQEWRTLHGDNLILSLIDLISELRARNSANNKVLLLISDRNKLDEIYNNWVTDNPSLTRDNSFNVITFLAMHNLLNIDKVKTFLQVKGVK